MTDGESQETEGAKAPSLLHNWISLLGIILAASAFFAVLCLLMIDLFAGFANPYMGILTYLVAPGFLVLGLLLISIGALWERRRRRRLAPGEVPAYPRIDLNVPHQRRTVVTISVVTFLFLLITALGSYRTYHFTESVQFCGQTCHTLMKPEFTAYQNSPHARVACVQCHIGPGADWFVKSKLSGTYQVYATLSDKFPRPIPTPIENLRPAQETCEQCHWPQKFFGNAERVKHHYMADETNTAWTIRMLMKIGGGDPEHGPVGGIHWHMNVANKVEYIHTDRARQVIPWVRFTEPDGTVTVFQDAENPLTEEEIAKARPRTMDCIDCHNRPSHIYHAPSPSVNIAMSTGRISAKIPYIKQKAVEALTKEYSTTDEALRAIPQTLLSYYESNHKEFLEKNRALVDRAISEVLKIYRNNFFPEMKVDWRTYPNHIGHSIFVGCYRCHDGKHVSAPGANGKTKTITHDCNACHTIIAQGPTAELTGIHAEGLEFQHPTDIAEMWKEMNCHECHTGALQ